MKTEILFHVCGAAEVWLQTPLMFEVVPRVSADLLLSPNVAVAPFYQSLFWVLFGPTHVF